MFEFLEDTNWVGFILLLCVGMLAMLGVFYMWGRMEYHVEFWMKLTILVLVVPISYTMSRMMFE